MKWLVLVCIVLISGCINTPYNVSKQITECTLIVDSSYTENSESKFNNIEDALNSIGKDQTICLNSGVYKPFRLDKFYNIDGGVMITSSPGSIAVIKAENYRGASIYLDNVNNVKIVGLWMTGGMYGVYATQSSNIEILDNYIANVGQEGIIVKAGTQNASFQSINISKNFITDTGKKSAQYGEGIYVGDGNVANGFINDVLVSENIIVNTTNEAIDIKENVTSAMISDNHILQSTLLFNGAITIGTSNQNGPISEYIVNNNTIIGVINKNGYRPYGIAVGHGNIAIEGNVIVENGEQFIGICVFTTFSNKEANNITIKDNMIVTKGQEVLEKCAHGGTSARNFADVSVL